MIVNIIPGLVGTGVPDVQTGRWTGLGSDGGHGASRKPGLCGTRGIPICIVELWTTDGIFDSSTTGADCANVTCTGQYVFKDRHKYVRERRSVVPFIP